jgi:hypothetical protein
MSSVNLKGRLDHLLASNQYQPALVASWAELSDEGRKRAILENPRLAAHIAIELEVRQLEKELAEKDRDALAREVRKALIVPTLQPGEELAELSEHIIVTTMERVCKERDAALRQLAGSGYLNHGKVTRLQTEVALLRDIANERDGLRAELHRSHAERLRLGKELEALRQQLAELQEKAG